MSTSATTHRMFHSVSSLHSALFSREELKLSTNRLKLSVPNSPETLQLSQPVVPLPFWFRDRKEYNSEQSRHMEPRNATNSTPSSSYDKLRRANTSSKHEISFLLNGPKPAKCDPVPREQMQTTPLPQQDSRGMRWREQQLWAVNELRELTSSVMNPSLNSANASAAHDDAKKTCAQCGKRFTQSADLKKHIKCVHLKARPFKCSQCPSAFGEKGNLNRHIKAVHIKERPWICPRCGLQFSFRDSLTRHIRAVHEDSRPFLCEYCQSAFKKKDHLLRHQQALHGARRK